MLLFFTCKEPIFNVMNGLEYLIFVMKQRQELNCLSSLLYYIVSRTM